MAWSPPRSVRDSPLDSPVGGNEKTTEWGPASRLRRAGHAPRGTPSTLTWVPSPSSTSCARAAGAIAGEIDAVAGGGGALPRGGSTGRTTAVGAGDTGGTAPDARACVVAARPRRNATTASPHAATTPKTATARRGAGASPRGSVSRGWVAVSASFACGGGRKDSIFRVDTSWATSGLAGGALIAPTSSRTANVFVPTCVAVGREGGRCRIGRGSVGGGGGCRRRSRTRSPR